MLILTSGSFRAETQGVVWADALLKVGHRALLALLAEPAAVKGTFLLPPVTCGNDMSVDTLISLLTVALLEEVSAYRHLVLVEDMQVVAVVSFLALTLQPMDADYLLVLRFICL